MLFYPIRSSDRNFPINTYYLLNLTYLEAVCHWATSLFGLVFRFVQNSD